MTKHTNARRAALPQELQNWLDRHTRTTRGVVALRIIRTSTNTVDDWIASAATSFVQMDRQDPDVLLALEHGFDVVRRDAIGDTKRLALGDSVFVVRMGHAQGGKGSKQIGVILHLGTTFFVYLLSSARAQNLAADSEDRRGNAATEIISTVVRTMAAAGRRTDATYRPMVYAREHDRIVRDESHGAAIKRTFVSARAIVHAPHAIDMLDTAAAQSFSFGTMFSSAAVEKTILLMNRKEIVLQANGGWYEPPGQMPFTHEPLTTLEYDDRTGTTVTTTHPHRAAVRDAAATAPILRALVDKILEDADHGQGPWRRTDWVAVGNLAAELGLPSRLARDLRRGVKLASLGEEARFASVRSLFSDRYIEGWRTGFFTKLVAVKTEMTLDLGEDTPLVYQKTAAGLDKPYYRCRIELPMPEGGWGVTDEEWEEVLRRRHPQKGQPRILNGERLPLGGQIGWDDKAQDREFQVDGKSNTYRLRARSLTAAQSPAGERRGWSRREKHELLSTMRTSALHRSVGGAMRQALENLGSATEPFSVAPRFTRPAHCSEPIDPRPGLVTECEDATAQLDGAKDQENETRGKVLQGRASSSELAACERASARALLRLQGAEEALAAHDSSPAEGTTQDPAGAVETVEQVTTATAELVAIALTKCKRVAPPWLHTACTMLLDDWTLTPTTNTGGRDTVRWSCTLRLRVKGRDEVIRVPLEGELFNSANAATERAATTPEDWAWSFFYRGVPGPQLAKDLGLSTGEAKNSYLSHGLRGWMGEVITDPTLMTAALHCPVPALRRVIWSLVTGDDASLAGIDPGFARHIQAIYTGPADQPSWSWCRDTHERARSVAAHLVASADGSAAVHELVGSLQIPRDHLVAMTRGRGRGLSEGYFEKNFTRRTRGNHRISLRKCPHADCPAVLEGGQGLCSIMIKVPETGPRGVLCASCLRLPDPALADVWFPADYRRPWSGRYGVGSHAGARKNKQWTFLQPGMPDPGPADPLPETGALPRSGAPYPRRGSYVPKALVKASPLAAGLVRLADLDEDQTAAATAAITALGARVGRRLTKNVKVLVVSDAHHHHDDNLPSRARALGVPVLTLTQFLGRARDGWKE